MSRVLVAEDSPTQAQEMRWLLEEAGFEVEIAGDGLAALRALRHTIPDIVVTDLMMPRMDGLALVEAIRHDYPYLPVVLATAFGSEQVATRALRAGAASYVPKKDLDIDLVPTLQEILDVVVGRIEHHQLFRHLSHFSTRFVLDNDPGLVGPLVRYMEDVLSSAQFCDPAEVMHVGVALRESLINAIEHGNLELGPGREERPAHRERMERRRGESPYRDRRVYVEAEVSDSTASFLIRDEGPGFDVTGLPDPANPSNLCKSSGRGLTLIQTFMDDVTHRGAGNEVVLIKRGRALASP